jgi:hypothetical protein
MHCDPGHLIVCPDVVWLMTTTISGRGQIGQITIAANPTTGSSLNPAMVSSVM